MGPKAKSNSVQSKNQAIGKHVKYIGMGDNWYHCPSCNRKFARGFFWEENGINGCSQLCLKSLLPKEGE